MAEAKSNPTLIEVSIGRIFDFLEDSGTWNEDDPFPRSFINFFSDSKLISHLHHHIGQLRGPMKRASTQTDLVSTVRRLLTGDSRSIGDISLEALLNADITQLHNKEVQPVAVYAEHFRAQVNTLDREFVLKSQRWLCKLFLKGLIPALKSKCAFSGEGEEWNNLDLLVSKASVEEHKLFLASGAKRLSLNALYAHNSPQVPAKVQKTEGEKPKKKKKKQERGRPQDFPPKLSKENHKKFTGKVKRACTFHGTCFRCRTVQHPPNVECPLRGPGDPQIPPLEDSDKE